jgi:CheY-like chemotaxis protein
VASFLPVEQVASHAVEDSESVSPVEGYLFSCISMTLPALGFVRRMSQILYPWILQVTLDDLAAVFSSRIGVDPQPPRPRTAQAVALAREARPDVVVLDLVMPVMVGAEALGLILREVSPPPGVVILTMHDQPSLRRELMGMGASAFLAKSASLAEVIGAVKGACPLRKPREDSGGPSAT